MHFLDKKQKLAVERLSAEERYTNQVFQVYAAEYKEEIVESGGHTLVEISGAMPSDGAVERDAPDKPNLTGQVYEQLIDLLIRGELRPGDVITERRMAERLNASRTPVREALARLESEGLIYKQPNRGVTVSPFSTEAFVEVLNVRILLEAEAARLAAGRLPPEKVERIRQALNGLAAKLTPTLSEIWDVDDFLHGEIADAAGNTLMASLIRDLRRRTHVYNSYRQNITPSFGVQENTLLLDAIASGDQQRARQAMVHHIETVKTAIIERLSGAIR